MAWGRPLTKAIESNDLPRTGEWGVIASDRRSWQQRIGIRGTCLYPPATILDRRRERYDGTAWP